MFRSLITRFHFIVPLTLTALAVLLASCAPITTVQVPTAATQPPAEPTTAPTQLIPPEATIEPGAFSFNLDFNGAAQSYQVDTIPAVQQSNDHPYWDVLPQHVRITLQGYPISSHLMKPQIFIYPAKDLPSWNEGAARQVAALQALLASQQPSQYLPQMPLFNATQVMHAQVKFMEFKNGKGVRYVTQYDQAVLPINNDELMYTYQGLTNDGKYYVAVVMPLNFPGLAKDSLDIQGSPDEFMANFPAYLEKTVKTLNEADASSFTPDLATLDAMVQSLEIK